MQFRNREWKWHRECTSETIIEVSDETDFDNTVVKTVISEENPQCVKNEINTRTSTQNTIPKVLDQATAYLENTSSGSDNILNGLDRVPSSKEKDNVVNCSTDKVQNNSDKLPNKPTAIKLYLLAHNTASWPLMIPWYCVVNAQDGPIILLLYISYLF